MLRFRRDRLYIGIEPDRLTLVRLTGGVPGLYGSRVVASATVSCEESASDSARVETLRQTLRSAQWQKSVSHLILSDRLVRYFVADRPPGARNVEEVQLAAGLRFTDIFGVAANDWSIKLDLPPLATNQLGCAIRKTFVDNLASACAEARSPVATIVPFAVSEFNRWHSLIGRKDGWLAVAGRHSLWIGQKRGNDWITVHQHAVTADETANLATEFPRLMAQEMLRSVSSTPATPLKRWLSGVLGDSDTRERLAASPASLLGAPIWTGQPEEWSNAYRIALSPVWPACA